MEQENISLDSNGSRLLRLVHRSCHECGDLDSRWDKYNGIGGPGSKTLSSLLVSRSLTTSSSPLLYTKV